jgi:hypothetical protein
MSYCDRCRIDRPCSLADKPSVKPVTWAHEAAMMWRRRRSVSGAKPPLLRRRCRTTRLKATADAHASRATGQAQACRLVQLYGAATAAGPVGSSGFRRADGDRRAAQTAKASPRSEQSLSALNAACVRFVAPILRMMFRMWTFAVLSLMPSSWAMILFALPC